MSKNNITYKSTEFSHSYLGKKLIHNIVCILIITFAIIGCSKNNNNSQTEDTSGTNVVEANIAEPAYSFPEQTFVFGIDLSGLSKDDAFNKLNGSLEEIYSRKIQFTGANNTYEYTLSDLGLQIDATSTITNLIKSNTPTYTINEDSNNQILNTLKEAEEIKAVNASMTYTPNSTSDLQDDFTTINGTDGKTIDTELFVNDINTFINSNENNIIPLNFIATQPDFNSETMNFKKSVLGSQVTNYSGEGGRTTNLRTASNNISGWVLYPNEEFSTNTAFKSRIASNGYVNAPVIVNGGLEDGIGGGICQISSTLYCAVVYSELDILERRNHSLKVSYLPYAYDCTLAEGSIDFRFVNNTEYPILIHSTVENGKASVKIFGYESRPDNREIKLKNEFIQSYQSSVQEIEDPNLPLGKQVYDTKPLNGAKYNLYKDIYIDGALTDTILVNESTYRTRNGVLRIGTGAPEATETPVNNPVISQEPIAQDPVITQDPVVVPETEEPSGVIYDIPSPAPVEDVPVIDNIEEPVIIE